MFKVNKVNLKHHHDTTKVRSHKYRAVEEFIKDLPASVNPNNLKPVICSQFSISERQFYYLSKKATRPPTSLG